MEAMQSKLFNLGTSLGRGQAFGAIANQCAAAQAQSLLEIWESEAYKLADMTWEEFCPKMVGLSRQRVEGIIRNLKEFGAVYLQLSEIVNISPEKYRQILPAIQDDKIEIDGELVPIVPENAGRIREAVKRLRSGLRKANEEARQANQELDVLTSPEVVSLQSRLDSWLEDVRRKTPDPSLRSLVDYSIQHLQDIANRLAA